MSIFQHIKKNHIRYQAKAWRKKIRPPASAQTTADDTHSKADDEASKIAKVDLPNEPAQAKLAYLGLIMHAVKVIYGKELWLTQLMAVWLLLKKDSKTCRAIQKLPGTGKSIVIAVLAMMQELEVIYVDVATHTMIYAERDAEEFGPLYRLFGLTVAYKPQYRLPKR